MNADEESLAKQLALLDIHKKSIIIDLEVQDVLPELLEKLVFFHDDKQRVEHEITYEDRATVLINIVKRKAEDGNRDVIPVFVNSLKEKYAWLYSKLTQDELDFKVPKILPSTKGADHDQQKVKNILEAGGVQCLPRFVVDREDQVEIIREGVRTLKRHHYLVLTGMAGCGKSVLAMQSIHSVPLVLDTFKDGIFWLAIGKECSETKDAILAKMRILCDRLGELRAPNSLEDGAELLRTAFLKRPESLLILDDVWRPEVIRAFDIASQTLVTTRDSSVMDVVSGRVKNVKIPDGFTEKESLELFCRSLGTTLDKLPEEARSIHSECKGSPMVISLISALFHGYDISDTGRWNHYLNVLRKRRYSQIRRIRDYEHESVIDAISLSVDNLDPKDREYYFDFALFQDDVGIPCPVLMVLWNLGKYEVEDVMNRFVRKSLAVDEYDPQRKYRIYSVHDLQLGYLKYQIQCDGISEQELHGKLISKYLQSCGQEFEKLPDDGYIHFYLGYHLHKAHLFDYFPKAYLNFVFLGEKMKITGTADLLVDLRKYKDFIIGDKDIEKNTKLIEEITTFAQSVGHRLYNQTDIDIIQVALEMPYLGNIYKEASDMAKKAQNRLYIEWSNASSSEWKNPEAVVLCTDNVRCVKFVPSRPNHFLAGLSNGSIELCDIYSCQICYVYSGHASEVQAIDIFQRQNSPIDENLIFVSASDDKTCKLWDLKSAFENIESLNACGSSDSSPSPKIRSELLWGFEKSQDQSYLTFEFHTASIMHVEFSYTGEQVISTSINEILIWASKTGQIIQKISPDLPASPNVTLQACHFSHDTDSSHILYLLMTCENQVVLYARESPSIFSSIEGHHMKIVALLLLPNDAFCTVSENEVGLWKVVYGKSLSRSRSLSPRKSFPSSNFSDPSQSQNSKKTQVDALPIVAAQEKSYKAGELLRPSNLSSRNNSYSSGGRDSPTQISDCYSPSSVHTFIDTGSDFVKIFREELLPKKSSGLFQCAAVTDSGDILACGTSDRRVILWQLESRTYLGEFNSHTGTLRCLDFSRVDRLSLLSGSEDHTVMFWDVAEEKKGTKEPQKNLLYSSMFIDSSTTYGYFVSLFTTDRNSVQVFKDNKCIFESLPLCTMGFGLITSVALHKDGNTFVVGTKIGNLYRMILNQVPKKIEYSEKDFVLIGSSNKDKISHLSFDDEGNLLVAGTTAGFVFIFNNFTLFRTIESECAPIVQFHFPFDKVLAIVCRNDVLLRIENLKTGQRLKGWKTDDEVRVTCSSCTTIQTSTVALGTARNGIFVYELELESGITTASRIICRHSTSIRSLRFSEDKLRLAVGHDSGLITVWKLNNGTYEEELDLIFHKGGVRSLRFSPDGKWLASCGDKLAFWTFEKSTIKLSPPSFMAERRRKKSGDNSRPNSRLSLEIGEGVKIGRKGKRELLQSFFFRGAYAQDFVSDPYFKRFVTVDDSGVFYLLEVMSYDIR